MLNPASDLPIERLSALARIAAQHRVEGRVRLEALPEGLVAHILGYNTSALAMERLQKLADARALSLRETSLDQWFLVGDKAYSDADLASLAQDLQPDFILSDQSAGRVRLRIEGEGVTHILNKGIALDLELNAYPVGKSTACLCGHIGVHLTRQGPDLFEIIVLRSFAVDLWQELAHGCAAHNA